MDECSAVWKITLVGISAVFLLSCAGTREFREARAIKPLIQYESEVQRDIAQMLYPGFLEIQKEVEKRFSPETIHLKDDGMEVALIRDIPGMDSGYYVSISMEVFPQITGEMTFLEQAHIVGSGYFHKILLAVSRDWNRIFSSSLAGTVFIFEWKSDGRYRLRTVFDNQNIQDYLNARMTLQELVDKSWVEGWQDGGRVGRIELNGLQSIQA